MKKIISEFSYCFFFLLQSPRQDVVDNIRSAIKLEYENSLKVEQNRWERQMQQLKEEHEQTLVEMMSREKIRDIADQQVMFNEALNKAMEEKNRQVQDLQDKLTLLANNSADKNNICERFEFTVFLNKLY